MSYRLRLVWIFTLTLTMVGVLCALGGGFALAWRDARDEHDAAVRAYSAQADLAANLLRQAASIRGYFLDNEQRSLDDYVAARSEATAITAELERLSPPATVPAIEKVTQAALTWRTVGLNPIVATQQRGDVAAAQQEYLAGRPTELFAAVTSSLTGLRDAIGDARGAARREEHAKLVQLGEFSAAGVAVVGLGYAVIVWAADRWFSKPIAELRAALENGRTTSTFSQEAVALRTLRHRVDRTNQNSDWDVATAFGPSAARVGGDCLDVTADHDEVTIVVANALVSGPEAAVATLRVREAIVTRLRAAAGPEAVTVAAVARTHGEEIAAYKIGLLVARIDCSSGELRYVNTTGPRAFLCDGITTTPLVATDATTQWKTHPLGIGPGSLFVVTTGLTEQDATGVVLGRFGVSPTVVANQLLLAAVDGDGRRERDALAVVVSCGAPRRSRGPSLSIG